jgi:hypothetical protein
VSQATGYAKLQCRAAATGIVTKIGTHTFPAIAHHEDISLDETERIHV